jgi:hypothetical protein
LHAHSEIALTFSRDETGLVGVILVLQRCLDAAVVDHLESAEPEPIVAESRRDTERPPLVGVFLGGTPGVDGQHQVAAHREFTRRPKFLP